MHGHTQWQEANKSLDHLTIMYGGTAAVEILCHLHAWDDKQLRREEADDKAMVKQLCRELFVDVKQRLKVKRERLRQARAILFSHWEAVDGLATELLQGGWMPGGEVYQIIRRQSRETEPDWRLVAWGRT